MPNLPKSELESVHIFDALRGRQGGSSLVKLHERTRASLHWTQIPRRLSCGLQCRRCPRPWGRIPCSLPICCALPLDTGPVFAWQDLGLADDLRTLFYARTAPGLKGTEGLVTKFQTFARAPFFSRCDEQGNEKFHSQCLSEQQLWMLKRKKTN